ncbi:RIP homotypic interaction motif-containing protein [Burkholderia cenocepacia]|uniref:RIP homotypic interaction motif-containing protein n=1 Tax=Burkholderia cenocepacia TaxID=95486 RepID=UPI00286545B2|nr:RIP homotypic interaction motif-containing protein [Burkholderia cenocepacia]MDR8058738.1 hypothetical protein [Burkholderia cenocepacia]MDR8061174.1 hypothetical protein [Burkholderia cenocepacia]
MLHDLLRDIVYFQSASQGRVGPYKANVSGQAGRHSAILLEENLDVDVGAFLIRQLPGNREEAYQVLEANFTPGMSGIPSQWNLVLKKGTSLVETATAKPAPTFNFHNAQGVQIGDHNVLSIQNGLADLVKQIDGSAASSAEKAEAKGRLTKLLESPVIASVLGSAVSGLLSQLQSGS